MATRPGQLVLQDLPDPWLEQLYGILGSQELLVLAQTSKTVHSALVGRRGLRLTVPLLRDATRPMRLTRTALHLASSVHLTLVGPGKAPFMTAQELYEAAERVIHELCEGHNTPVPTVTSVTFQNMRLTHIVPPWLASAFKVSRLELDQCTFLTTTTHHSAASPHAFLSQSALAAPTNSTLQHLVISGDPGIHSSRLFMQLKSLQGLRELTITQATPAWLSLLSMGHALQAWPHLTALHLPDLPDSDRLPQCPYVQPASSLCVLSLPQHAITDTLWQQLTQITTLRTLSCQHLSLRQDYSKCPACPLQHIAVAYIEVQQLERLPLHAMQSVTVTTQQPNPWKRSAPGEPKYILNLSATSLAALDHVTAQITRMGGLKFKSQATAERRPERLLPAGTAHVHVHSSGSLTEVQAAILAQLLRNYQPTTATTNLHVSVQLSVAVLDRLAQIARTTACYLHHSWQLEANTAGPVDPSVWPVLLPHTHQYSSVSLTLTRGAVSASQLHALCCALPRPPVLRLHLSQCEVSSSWFPSLLVQCARPSLKKGFKQGAGWVMRSQLLRGSGQCSSLTEDGFVLLSWHEGQEPPRLH